ncbi:MAG: hypothetical protein COB23_02480 [Methylophaga sp.]|nr:MAG: hypothetical protein COB23_02480 [Methylophaga sp.]
MFFINPLLIIRSSTVILLLLPCLLFAHNNPEFINKPLSSVEVELLTASGSNKNANSAEFIIVPPKETVRVVWSVNSDNKDKVIFSVKQGNKIIAKDIQNGAETDPNLINGEMLVITDVKGAEASFKLDILARLIVVKNKKGSADTSAGKRVYKKANCMGCHKWHGAGGGGYGGAALSLRTTQLDYNFIKYTVRCGRPETGMPYHGRKSYKGDDISCYDVTGQELAEDKPPRARSLISERDIDAVVKYVVNVIKGSGEPNFDQCVAFWGEKSRQCDSFKP